MGDSLILRRYYSPGRYTMRLFSITPNETEVLNAWIKTHSQICPVAKAAGDRSARAPVRTFCFSITPIGRKIEVRCRCGAVKDITDYDAW